MPKKDFPVIPPDRADDLHNLEIADSSDLVLFMAGMEAPAWISIQGLVEDGVEKLTDSRLCKTGFAHAT
jgi:hypothetical protein